jgi:hypothetical protein
MSVNQIDKSRWKAFFDTLTDTLVGKRAEIEVTSLDLGDQVEAEWLPVLGIVYDPKDDSIEVALEGLDHMIRKPREVHVDFDVGGLMSIEVIDQAGVHQIVKLKDPIALAAPNRA